MCVMTPCCVAADVEKKVNAHRWFLCENTTQPGETGNQAHWSVRNTSRVRWYSGISSPDAVRVENFRPEYLPEAQNVFVEVPRTFNVLAHQRQVVQRLQVREHLRSIALRAAGMRDAPEYGFYFAFAVGERQNWWVS